jgi:D-alanine-D-alanine ligase-like ATP-grasp enzyme
MPVGIFTEYNVLLYVARKTDTDYEAITAAKRRGVGLPRFIKVRREDGSAKVYEVSDTGNVVEVEAKRPVT